MTAKPIPGIAGFKLTAAGAPVSPQIVAQMLEIVVDARLRVPDRLTLRIRDDNTKILDAKTFAVGTAVQATLTSADGKTTAQVFDGQVTSLAPEFEGRAVMLTVIALDRGCLLQRAPATKGYTSMSYGAIAEQLASAARLSAGTISDGLTLPYVQQSNETPWDFLWRLALDVDYEVKVTGSELNFAAAGGSASGSPLPLTLNKQLWRFSPRVTGVGQVDSVAVRGWDPTGAQAIAASATPAPTLSTPGTTRASVADGLGAGTAAIVDRPIYDQAHATSVAKSVAAQIANAYVEGEGVLAGNPSLKPGSRVTIAGVGKAFGGTYAVSGVRHVVRAGARYETQFFVSGCEDRSLLGLAGASQAPRPGWGQRIVVGTVTTSADPDNLGRVRVSYPGLDDELQGWWARIVAPGAGAGRGLLTVPQVGDEVLVAFEHGNEQHPYVIGSVYNGTAKPGDLSMTDGTFSLTSQQKLTVVAADAVAVTGKTMTYSSSDAAAFTTTGSGTIDVDAKGALTLQSSQDVTLQAGKAAALSATASLKISCAGGEITLNPGGQVEVQGTMVTVQASGVLKLAGATVMLG